MVEMDEMKPTLFYEVGKPFFDILMPKPVGGGIYWSDANHLYARKAVFSYVAWVPLSLREGGEHGYWMSFLYQLAGELISITSRSTQWLIRGEFMNYE